jgi:hypothetical protein
MQGYDQRVLLVFGHLRRNEQAIRQILVGVDEMIGPVLNAWIVGAYEVTFILVAFPCSGAAWAALGVLFAYRATSRYWALWRAG